MYIFSILLGVVALNNKIYCIGGCTGQRCIVDCEAYDPVTNKWHSIASLNEGNCLKLHYDYIVIIVSLKLNLQCIIHLSYFWPLV